MSAPTGAGPAAHDAGSRGPVTLEPHHDGSPLYVPPGTPRLDDTVRVRLRVPVGTGERAVHLRTVRDGEPVITPCVPDGEDALDRWYAADVVVHNPVTAYRFLLDLPDGYRWLNGRGLHARDVTDAADFRLTVHPPGPAWLSDGVVYQVFPDRFARSADASTRPLPEWASRADWHEEPAAVGRGASQSLYGGDLRGIEEHLDHLERLGVTTLYLTPFFPARSNHRYDASSFDHVDPVLGGDAALESLAAAVHARGLRIMGDLTTNHTGAAHEWFLRARLDPGSEEHSFYYWTADGPGYASWLGFASLPKLNYGSPTLARRVVDGQDSVAARWLREPYRLDGWRIDVANMTGRHGADDHTLDVARTLRRTIETARADAALVAEHFHDATGDLPGDGWHATMNYSAFTRPVWSWLARADGDPPLLGLPVPHVRRTGRAMVDTMRDFDSCVPWSVTQRQWNMLGSHDTARFRTLVGADPALLEAGVGLLMTFPGTPVVFAGDEVGAVGRNGEHARVTMPWDDACRWDDASFDLYRALIAVRRGSAALREGGLRWVLTDDDAVGFLRETPAERVLVVVARAPWAGASLPGALAPTAAEPLYGGPVLVAGGPTLDVPGGGAGVRVWRLT